MIVSLPCLAYEVHGSRDLLSGALSSVSQPDLAVSKHSENVCGGNEWRSERPQGTRAQDVEADAQRATLVREKEKMFVKFSWVVSYLSPNFY